jgi:hydroxymethylpyrimidine pyrophosphatase-like HAD family hydrolase
MTDTPTVICDLDGTLCNIDHRLHYLKENKDWDTFYDNCDKDKPNLWCVKILESLANSGVNIVFVSGRRSSTWDKTTKWFHDNLPVKVWLGRELYMRQDGDYRKDCVIKKEIFDEHLTERNILFALDDRQQVVDMWRKQGLVCLQVAKGDF